jgi:hypothetical protein
VNDGAEEPAEPAGRGGILMDAMTPPAMMGQAMMHPSPSRSRTMSRSCAPARWRRPRAVSVPPEEFGIDRNARSVSESNYCFHRVPTHTEGSLIAQGYDAEKVKKLPTYSFSSNTEQLARDTVDEEMWASGDDANRAARPVEIIEHYIWMDYEGNDKPCLYKVTTGSTGEVLTKDGEPTLKSSTRCRLRRRRRFRFRIGSLGDRLPIWSCRRSGRRRP